MVHYSSLSTEKELNTVYMKYSLDINFAKPSYLCIAEKFHGKNFANAVKIAMYSMRSLMQDKNFA